jgi:hypothetical protein
MTKAEFVEKYGDIKVKFANYYKYSFTFEGVLLDGNRLAVRIGGSSDDIYRQSVSADIETTVADLSPYTGIVYKKDGEEVESFYEY